MYVCMYFISINKNVLLFFSINLAVYTLIILFIY